MQLLKSLFFTAFMMVSALAFGGFMALCFLAPYRTQFAIARSVGAAAVLAAGKGVRPDIHGRGPRTNTRRQSHRDEQPHFRVGDHRAVPDFPAAGLGTEARVVMDSPHWLGLKTPAAHLDQSGRGASRGEPGHRAGEGTVGRRPVDHYFSGGHARRGGGEAQIRCERRSSWRRKRASSWCPCRTTLPTFG